MKKLLTLFIALSALISCSSSSSTDTPPVSEGVTLSLSSITVSAAKCEKMVTVEADCDWGVSSEASWCEVSPGGGVAGSTVVKIEIAENKTGDVRSTNVVFKTAAGRTTLPIKQNYDVEEAAISDAAFRSYLVENFDKDSDGVLSTKEASEVTEIKASNRGIKSMSELATYFTQLTYLDCSSNQLTELDVAKLTKLKYLNCSNNNLTSINIQNLQRLETFDCTGNSALTTIYVWFDFEAPAGFKKPDTAEYVEPSIPAPAGYTLVWQDEFDTPGESTPSNEKWWYETGDGGWGNNELQDYVSGGLYNGKKIACVSDGTLKITAQKIDGKVRSVRMNTKESWTYGYFEARLKLCKGKGTWPAFWMMPKNFRAWPDDGEIDIMEHVGYHENYVSSSIHCKAYYHSIGTQKTHEMLLQGATSEFHTYAAEWTEEYLKFYFDGELHFTFRNDGKGDYNTWPFYNPFYLKLNLAWGGNWGGAMGIDESCLPATYEIDYVRVFKKIE